MGASLDMERIAKELGAERRGKVSPAGGYFGALQLAAEVTARFRVPEGGGRATDPSWSEQRLVRLSPKTLEQLREDRRAGARKPDAGRGAVAGTGRADRGGPERGRPERGHSRLTGANKALQTVPCGEVL